MSAKIKSIVITQSIALVGFVVVPTLVTLIMPLTTLEFSRRGWDSSVTVTRYALIFVPWQTRRIDNVRELEVDIKGGERYANTSENRRKGQAGTYQMATGQLTLNGDGPALVVQAAPDKGRRDCRAV